MLLTLAFSVNIDVSRWGVQVQVNRYYRLRDQDPNSFPIYLQAPGYWSVHDGVHEPSWTAGTLPDSVMSTLEEITEEETAKLFHEKAASLGWAARRDIKPGRWKPVVAYVVGWMVGTACLWELFIHGGAGDYCIGLFCPLLALWAFLLGLLAAGVGLAAGSFRGWRRLTRGALATRLLAIGVACGAAMYATWAVTFLVLAMTTALST